MFFWYKSLLKKKKTETRREWKSFWDIINWYIILSRLFGLYFYIDRKKAFANETNLRLPIQFFYQYFCTFLLSTARTSLPHRKHRISPFLCMSSLSTELLYFESLSLTEVDLDFLSSVPELNTIHSLSFHIIIQIMFWFKFTQFGYKLFQWVVISYLGLLTASEEDKNKPRLKM